MNTRILPQSDEFPLAWEYDDALDRERFVDAKIEDEEKRDEAAQKAFTAAYLQCVNTLDWSSLARDGQQPALYWFRPIAGRDRQRLKDMDCGPAEKHGLAFRLALSRIEHGPSLPKLDPKKDPEYPRLGAMLPADAYELLMKFETPRTGSLVEQLGMFAWTRSTDLLPL